MRTFQEFLVDKYAVPFLEYINTLDEESQLDLISSLSEETLTILECVSTGQEFEASNTAFNELRYDLNEEFQLDEGSNGLARQQRKSSSYFKKNGFISGRKTDQRWAHKRLSSEKRARKEADYRSKSGLSANVLVNPKLVKRLAQDKAHVNRVNQYDKSQERKSQGQPETRKPKSISKTKFLDKRKFG